MKKILCLVAMTAFTVLISPRAYAQSPQPPRIDYPSLNAAGSMTGNAYSGQPTNQHGINNSAAGNQMQPNINAGQTSAVTLPETAINGYNRNSQQQGMSAYGGNSQQQGIPVYGGLPTADYSRSYSGSYGGSYDNGYNNRSNVPNSSTTCIVQDGGDLWIVIGNIQAKIDTLYYMNPNGSTAIASEKNNINPQY